MLFNSYEFIFVFMPVTLALFLLLKSASRRLALSWLIVASLGFYAWWRPLNVLIMLPSVLVNFALARVLQRLAGTPAASGARRALLALGIVLNVCFLGFFKYVTFVQTTVNELAGTDFVVIHVVLPLGISFITFQKIAFLIDVYSGRVEKFSFRHFCLFVLFFPQLIAGPIVHFREMMPQYLAIERRLDKEALAVGATLFIFGLFKKVVLADGIAQQVSPIYALAGSGQEVALIAAWTAALGFTLQIYFDFSGYSDMACGLARCFGVRLPINFNSPLKASNIIDFWAHWHITLTRFLTAYVYTPLVLWLTRRRARRGLQAMRARNPNLGAFVQLLVGPTLLTMFISGLWHGTGYVFMLWGILHGVYLCLNHAWRVHAAHRWPRERYQALMRPLGFGLTFVAVVFAMVLFRAPSVVAAGDIFAGMLGLHGISLPPVLLELAGLDRLGVFSAGTQSLSELVTAAAWLLALLAIALGLPNALELLERHEPVLGFTAPAHAGLLSRRLAWAPNVPWTLLVGALAAASVMRLGGKSEFLYWQF